MSIPSKLTVSILAVALVGCSTLKSIRSPGVPSNPWLGEEVFCKSAAACTFDEAIGIVSRAQAYCMDLRGFYERGGQVTGSQRLFVGLLGSLAGSVFAVVAGGTAAKAWAGLSGATNGIQTQIDQNAPKAGGSEVVENIAREQIRFSNDIKASFKTSSWNDVVNHAVLLPDACSAQAGLGLAKAATNAGAAASAVASAASAAASAETAASAALPSAPAASSAAARR